MPHSHYTYPFQAHLNTQALPKPSPWVLVSTEY
jgi:hypothetical protein